MEDAEDKTSEQLAAELGSPRNEQADPADDGSYSPVALQPTSGELILGKFKTQNDLIASYKELERNFSASRQAGRTQPQPAAAAPETVFDADTFQGIKSVVKAELEQERAFEFARKHKEDLADPLLRGAVLIEIQEANARGEYMSQESALANAKKALEIRLTPKVAEASKESFAEGKDLARRKLQAGAVGGVTSRSPEIDPDDLNAEDYAAYHGLK